MCILVMKGYYDVGFSSKKTVEKLKKFFYWVVFIAYLILLSYLLFFSEYYGRTTVSDEYRYNLVPLTEIKRYVTNYSIFSEASLTNIGGNIVAFMPFGFCLPLIDKKENSFFRILSGTAVFSLCIECVQLYYKVGSFDVDDIILNTIGGVAGLIAFRVIFRKKKTDRKQ